VKGIRSVAIASWRASIRAGMPHEYQGRFLSVRTATFRQAPGSAALRPPADSGVPGIALAGAWTDTGWPATMESAVRSGHAAAETLLAQPAVAKVAQ